MRFFSDTGTAPDEYDRVFTGDLGQVGSDLLHRLLLREGCDLRSRHSDCGLMIFDRTGQDVHAGASAQQSKTIPAIAHLVNFRAE